MGIPKLGMVRNSLITAISQVNGNLATCLNNCCKVSSNKGAQERQSMIRRNYLEKPLQERALFT